MMYMCAYLSSRHPCTETCLGAVACLTRGKAQVAPPSDDEEPEPVQEIVSWTRFCGATGDRSNLGYH